MKAPVITRFETAANQLIQQLSTLTEAQLNTVPFEGSWTAGQLGDHLYKSYDIISVLNGKVTDTDRDPAEKLPDIEVQFMDFSIKMESPDFILPTDKPINKDQFLTQLKQRVADLLETIEGKDLSKTCLDFEVPTVGPFTRHEWFGFAAIHTERHLHQLGKIKSALNE